jgi:hypothetical protein
MACKALTSTILRSGGVSRFVLLSGTPIDKEKHAINMMEMMGFIRAHKLYTFSKEENKLRLIGAQELVDFCKTVDPKSTLEFLKYNPFTKENVSHNCYLLFQKVIKKNISTAMPPPTIPVDTDVANGYYNIELEEDRKKLVRGIVSLQSSVMFNEEKGTTDVSRGNFANIQPSLVLIEAAKTNSMARVAIKRLRSTPQSKIVISVNFNDNVERLKEILKDYNPLVLIGSVDKRARQPIIDKFQANNLEHRVLIGNTSVIAVGLDLDDKFGNIPRYAFISPNYSTLNLQQVIYRFYRSDTKGASFVRFFYGVVGRKENSILKSLRSKSLVMKDTLDVAVENGVKFLADLADEFEN